MVESESREIALVDELARLQRGRGLQRPDVASQVGPHLRHALGLRDDLDNETLRQRVGQGLARHAESLPPDMQFVFLTALALRPTSRAQTGARLEDAGEVIDRHVRTVRRRLTQANQRVAAQLALASPEVAKAGPAQWYFIGLSTEVDLTQMRPVHRNTHHIRVLAPKLTHIRERVSFPGAAVDTDPGFRVSGPCTLTEVTRPYASSWVFALELDRPYLAGEELVYTTQVRSPSRRVEDPMSVILPMRDCLKFTTTVNFGRPSVAEAAWRLEGVPGPVAEEDRACGPLVDLDENERVTVEFTDLQQGHVYGLRWRWSEAFERAG